MPQQMPWDIARTFKDKRDGPYQITQPQDPAVLEQRGLGNAATRTTIDKNNIDIGNAPLTRENLQANINQSRNAVTNSTIDNEAKLRTEFMGAPSVKEFQQALPKFIAATRAKDNPVGDMQIITAWVKAYDPTGSVMTGDVTTAEQAQSAIQKLTGQTQALFGGNGRLTPEVRKNFLDETHTRLSSLADAYRQERANYSHISQRTPGVNPDNVIGDPFQKAFQQGEADYLGRPIRNLDGTQGMAPHGQERVPFDPSGQGDIGFNQPRADPGPAMSGEQQGAYDAFWRANPHATPEQLHAFGTSIGVEIHNADAIIHARKLGAGVQPGSTAILQPPDISDVRGGKNTPTQDGYSSLVRGILDTPTFGTFDKLAAGANTLFDGGTMKDNLAREYAISDYDQAQHPYLRMGGQAFGGALIPVGEMGSLAQIAAKSGAMGAAYGAGSSRSFGDVPANVLLGGATGAALGAGIGKAGQYIRGRNGMAEMPPLVDPVTGELNQPMNAMRPADRVQTMKDYGLKTITPGMAGGRSARIGEQVLNNLPASAGHMEDVYSGASRELRNSMHGVAQKFGQSKTLNEGGAEAQRGANEWIARADRVDAKAYNAIPIHAEAPTSTGSTVAFLQQNASRFGSNPELQKEMSDPTLARYLDAIQKHGLSWQDLKEFRTFVGAKGGQFRFSQDPAGETYRSLYGALSEDMRNSAAAQGPRAIHAFERANSFHAAMETRIESGLTHILGNDAKLAPEQAAARIQAMTMGGKGGGDLARLAQVRASTIKSGAWDEIASTLIHLGGQPAKSEGRAFQPATFVNWYSDMAEPARKMLFKPELRKELDGFVAMNQQLLKVRALNNNSNTGPLVMGGAQLLQGAKMLLSADLAGLAIQGGANIANYALGKAWTTPEFVHAITGFGRAVASGNPAAVSSMSGRLSKLAARNPELQAPLVEMQRHLLSGANDNIGQMGRAVASPDQRPDQEQRPYR